MRAATARADGPPLGVSRTFVLANENGEENESGGVSDEAVDTAT